MSFSNTANSYACSNRCDDAVSTDEADVAGLMSVLCAELPPAQAARIAARITKRPRSELYDYAVKMPRDDSPA